MGGGWQAQTLLLSAQQLAAELDKVPLKEDVVKSGEAVNTTEPRTWALEAGGRTPKITATAMMERAKLRTETSLSWSYPFPSTSRAVTRSLA